MAKSQSAIIRQAYSGKSADQKRLMENDIFLIQNDVS